MGKEKYQIISDSSCDLTLEMAEQLKVKIVPFYVSFDDKNYKKEKIYPYFYCIDSNIYSSWNYNNDFNNIRYSIF